MRKHLQVLDLLFDFQQFLYLLRIRFIYVYSCSSTLEPHNGFFPLDGISFRRKVFRQFPQN